MKKFFMCAVAVAATMSLTSCLSEEETNLTNAEKGYISLDVTAENALTTRATTDVKEAPDSWTVALAGPESKTVTVGTLASTPLTPGDYTVNVYNYATLAEANNANSYYGDAYYTGNLGMTGENENTITVTTGAQAQATIACGKAKNAKLSIETNIPETSVLNITVTNNRDNRSLTFKKTAEENVLDHATAFFTAGSTLTFEISYTIYGHSGNNTGKTNTLLIGGAGTENKLIISSDQTGTITFTTITYDNGFDDGQKQTITIEAATGNVLSVTNEAISNN